MNKTLIYILNIIFIINTNAQQADISYNLIQADASVAKNLAKNLIFPETNIAYIQFIRDLKNELFGTNNLNSNQQTFWETIKNKIDENKFKETSNIYKEKIKEAQAILATYKAKTSDENSLKKIIDKLSELITSISIKINIEKNILFEQFQLAGLFKEFESISEIKDFLKNQINQDKSSKSSLTETEASELGAYIFAAATGGLTLTALIKNYLAKRASNKLTIDFNKFDQKTYSDIQKKLDNAIKSKNIKEINNELDNLASKIKDLTSKEVYPKDLLQDLEKIESISQELGQDLINKLRISNGLEIEKNSPLFESIFGVDNNLGKIFESQYIEVVRAHDIEALTKFAEKITPNVKAKYGNELNKSDILKLMHDHDKDIQSIFKEKKAEFEQLNINLEKAKKINIESPKSQVPSRVLKIQEVGLKLNLNPTQIRTLQTHIDTFKPGEYAKIGEKIYQIDLSKNLVEIHNPAKEIFLKAHEVKPIPI